MGIAFFFFFLGFKPKEEDSISESIQMKPNITQSETNLKIQKSRAPRRIYVCLFSLGLNLEPPLGRQNLQFKMMPLNAAVVRNDPAFTFVQ